MGAVRDRQAVFPERLELRLPRGCSEALDALASQQSRTRAETVRQLILAALAEHGVVVAASVTP